MAIDKCTFSYITIEPGKHIPKKRLQHYYSYLSTLCNFIRPFLPCLQVMTGSPEFNFFQSNSVIAGTHLMPVDDHSLRDDLPAFVLSVYSESEKTKKV